MSVGRSIAPVVTAQRDVSTYRRACFDQLTEEQHIFSSLPCWQVSAVKTTVNQVASRLSLIIYEFILYKMNKSYRTYDTVVLNI